MTNSSLSSALKGIFVLSFAVLAGCGENDGSANYQYGCAAFEAGNLAGASAEFRECLSHAPANVDALLMLTRTALRLGEVDQAVEAVTQAETLAGGDPDVIELVGQVAFQAEDFDRSRAAFAKLAANTSFGASVQSRGYAGLGVLDYARIKQETLDETAARARTELLTAIRLDARNAAAHYHLGRLYADIFHYSAIAKSELELFVYLAPKDDPRTIRVRDNLIPEIQEGITAELPAGSQDYAAVVNQAKRAATAKEALKYYKIASQIRPSDCATLIALGDTAIKVGSPAVAEQAYSRAVAARPKDATALARLVSTLRKNGKSRVADIYQRYSEALPARKR